MHPNRIYVGMNTIVELTNLSKSFGSLKAVDNMDLRIAEKEIFGLLGPNGAGKSTTLRMMLSLIRPSSGSIRIFGQDLSTQRNAILQRIGCIIEKPDFYLYMSALENLRIFGALSHTPRLNSRIEEMLELVGLKGREKDLVKTYSHGMKQRLGLAQALLHDPELIVLDEPTTGLDPQGIIELRNLILYLKNDQHKTVVLSSHILSEIEMIADRMAIINRGKAVVQGKVQELLSVEDMRVRILTSKVPAAVQALKDMAFACEIPEQQAGGELVVQCSREDIPGIVEGLGSRSVPIFGVQATRSLEDFFLRITAASENTHPPFTINATPHAETH